MDAQEQIVEGESALDRNDDLTVENELPGLERRKPGDDLREVARQGLPGLRLQRDLIAIAEREHPEPIPLRLEHPVVARRKRVTSPGQHRCIGWANRQGEPRKSAGG